MTRYLHAIVLATLAVRSPAFAQAPAPNTRATIILTDRSQHEGRLVEVSAGKSVVLELPDGSIRSFKWRDLESLAIDGPSTVSATPVASGPAQLPAQQLSRQPTGRTDSGRGSAGARLESTADCAQRDEGCTEQTNADLGRGGLGLSYSRESVGRVKRPPSGAFNFTFSASYYGAFGENMMMNGAGFGGSARAMVGSRFPGPRGGHWFGVFVEPSVAFNFASVTITMSETQQQTSSATVALGQLGAGMQWMRFGRMDLKTLKQSGFGLALGGTAGYQSTSSEGYTSGAASYGPQISMLFPRYNAGTARYRATNVNLFILPTKDMVMFMAGVQFVL